MQCLKPDVTLPPLQSWQRLVYQAVSSCEMSHSYVCLLSQLKLWMFIKMHLSHKISVAGSCSRLLTQTVGWSLLSDRRCRWYMNIFRGKEIKVICKTFLLPLKISTDQMSSDNTPLSPYVNKNVRAHSLFFQPKRQISLGHNISYVVKP